MQVFLGVKFSEHFLNFPVGDQEKIRQFIEHVQQFGFEGLQGRNKPSDDVPTDNPHWGEIVTYAQEHQLWHFHIGIPSYTTSEKGDLTSEYVLHYVKGDNFIKIVDLSDHPPLKLPSLDYLI